jgi:hypothetical protein
MHKFPFDMPRVGTVIQITFATYSSGKVSSFDIIEAIISSRSLTTDERKKNFNAYLITATTPAEIITLEYNDAGYWEYIDDGNHPERCNDDVKVWIHPYS